MKKIILVKKENLLRHEKELKKWGFIKVFEDETDSLNSKVIENYSYLNIPILIVPYSELDEVEEIRDLYKEYNNVIEYNTDELSLNMLIKNMHIFRIWKKTANIINMINKAANEEIKSEIKNFINLILNPTPYVPIETISYLQEIRFHSNGIGGYSDDIECINSLFNNSEHEILQALIKKVIEDIINFKNDEDIVENIIYEIFEFGDNVWGDINSFIEDTIIYS